MNPSPCPKSSGEPNAVWRFPDGRFSTPPDGEQAEANSALVRPGTDGTPAFPVPFPVRAGDVVSVRLRIEARRTEADEGAEGQGGIILTLLPRSERNNDNPNAEHRQIAIVGMEPESMRFAFRAGKNHAAEELVLLPTLSYFGRTLLLTEVCFENHGRESDPAGLTSALASYSGQEPHAPWRAEAEERVERFRKAPLRVVVTDRHGNPLPGARVSVEQVRHAYPFGTAVVSSRMVDSPREISPESGISRETWLADNARYREEILRNFNAVVTENDLKWPQWAYSNQSDGIYHQNWTQEALDWFRKHEIIVKGHNLIWGSWRFAPDWLRELEEDPEAVQRAIETHIRDMGSATADVTRYWDVLNEPMSHRNLIELLGMDKVAAWFKSAREVMPDVRFVMNEFDLVGNGGSPTRRKNFLAFYRELADRGAPVDLIGFQGHFWSERFTAPEDIWRIIDEVHGATGLPLMVSEFDTNLPNERLQADYTRDFLTAWFAHPATEAFIMWGFWGGSHWMGDAGAMFRRDWTEKPNLAAYRDLVYGKWWTRETLETNAQGEISLRAFLGQHRLEFDAPGQRKTTRTLRLDREGRTLHVVLHPLP